MAASFSHKMQNIKMHYDSYMQWVTEVYSEPSQKSIMKLFCKNSQQLNYFRKKSNRKFQLGSKYASVLPAYWSTYNVNETIYSLSFRNSVITQLVI